MTVRPQQTIKRSQELQGIGFFTNAEITLTLNPAPANHGIQFQRVDLSSQPLIPATISHLVPAERRTKVAHQNGSVELIEHLMAALAGLQVDNVLIQIDGPEVPGGDGSALPFVDALISAEIEPLTEMISVCSVGSSIEIKADESLISATPTDATYSIQYELDYGPHSAIPAQSVEFEMTPAVFLSEIAPARTFILEQEIAYLKQQGYGQKVSEKDLLIIDHSGPLKNHYRFPNECARHKLLDCLGDFALCGSPIHGRFQATKSGHQQNHIMADRLAREPQTLTNCPTASAA